MHPVKFCGEDDEVVERFTDLVSDIHVSAGCESEVNRGQQTEPGESWIHWIMGCGAAGPVWEDESPSLQVLGASSLALWM